MLPLSSPSHMMSQFEHDNSPLFKSCYGGNKKQCKLHHLNVNFLSKNVSFQMKAVLKIMSFSQAKIFFL